MTRASEILDAVGGRANVAALTHCATRLRFQLHDQSLANPAVLANIPDVIGAVPQGSDRYQVIIGGAVAEVYSEIMALDDSDNPHPYSPHVSPSDSAPEPTTPEPPTERSRSRGAGSITDSFFEFLSDSFRPIVGALLGASLFITFMSLMATLGVIGHWADDSTQLSASWSFVNLLWKSVFTFLPLMVAYNASKRAGADPWVGFAIMGLVMLPEFGHLASHPAAYTAKVFGNNITLLKVFGIPLTIFDYSSQVFPPLIMAVCLGSLYRGLKRIIPANVQLIFVPFFAMLVMLPLTAFVIGPIGVYAGAVLAGFLTTINGVSTLIFAVAIPLLYPLMVPLGLHWPINAVILLSISENGVDYIQGPMGAWNFACFGAAAGVLVLAWRERDVVMRQTASGALAAGLLGGISEPALYGIILRFKRIYPSLLLGCLAGGLVMGIGGGVTTNAFLFTSVLTIPAFHSTLLYVLGIAAAFGTSLLAVLIRGYRVTDEETSLSESYEAF